jgi:hypothetical protein
MGESKQFKDPAILPIAWQLDSVLSNEIRQKT